MKILVTGVAGFIGFHLAQKLLSENHEIIGVDNINDYYDIGLKETRLELLTKSQKFKFIKTDISDYTAISKVFEENEFSIVVHLAAQAGVRYSNKNPFTYINSNVNGQLNLLEATRQFKPDLEHFIFASSSSVYGNSDKVPFNEAQNTDEPVSLYAATKKSGENIASSYAKLYGIKTTGLRFFTVYGAFGRPDMAYFSFTKNIISGKHVKLFNHGNLKRDFTYITDIIDGLERIINQPARQNFGIYNIGNNKPVELKYFVEVLEKNLGKKANIELCDMQQGDVYQTYADIQKIRTEYGFEPKTTIEEGIERFVKWYKSFYAQPN